MSRIFFVANAVWGDLVGGGDIHFFELARGAAAAGHEVIFLGGPALQQHLAKHKIPGRILLTESKRRPKINEGTLVGQIQMFADYIERCFRSLLLLREIQPEDSIYAVTDYWCDSIPALLSRAGRKAMVFHMEAPTLLQILTKGRPDVEAGPLASLHYWFSQNFSLSLFRHVAHKHLFYLHPAMQGRLLDQGYEARELSLISYGVETTLASTIPDQPKQFDVCWIGRVHRQKGIEDLLATLKHLADKLPGFRAIIMGKVEAQLKPRIQELGMTDQVQFSGFISEEDKVRIFKASRLFLMPSRHEGSPRVVGEALICGVPVLAYNLPNYGPVFGDFARYVPSFDLTAFKAESERLIRESRDGHCYLDQLDLVAFRKQNSWEHTRQVFLDGLNRITPYGNGQTGC